MPFNPKQLGLSLDRGNNKPPQLRVTAKLPDIGVASRTATGLVVVKLKGFQPLRGIFHMRDSSGEVRKHNNEVVKILDQNSLRIDLFMGDLLVYEFGSYAMCIYVTFAIGKGSYLKWEAVKVSGGFTTPPHIKTALIEAVDVFGKIGTVPDEELLIPSWPTTPYKPSARRRKRNRHSRY